MPADSAVTTSARPRARARLARNVSPPDRVAVSRSMPVQASQARRLRPGLRVALPRVGVDQGVAARGHGEQALARRRGDLFEPGRQDEAGQGHLVLVRAACPVGQVGQVTDLARPAPAAAAARQARLRAVAAALPAGRPAGGPGRGRRPRRRARAVRPPPPSVVSLTGAGGSSSTSQVRVGEQVGDRRRLGQGLGQAGRGADRGLQVARVAETWRRVPRGGPRRATRRRRPRRGPRCAAAVSSVSLAPSAAMAVSSSSSSRCRLVRRAAASLEQGRLGFPLLRVGLRRVSGAGESPCALVRRIGGLRRARLERRGPPGT